jgi:type II secretory pathway component GspD/PulD (secretin)
MAAEFVGQQGPALGSPAGEPKAPEDPKMILKMAREAMDHQDYDQAAKLARLADKESGIFTFATSSDSPSRVLREINTRRAAEKKMAAPGSEPKNPAIVQAPPSNKADSDKARSLIKEARAALQAGKLDDARNLANQARLLKADLGFREDNPDRVLSDVKRAEDRKARLDAKPGPAGKNPKEGAAAELRKGRELLAQNKLEDAAKIAARIKAMKGVSWGLFDDTPDQLQTDVEKARIKRDRGESARVLAEGRRLFEKGDLDGATRAAYRAERMHGPYSLLDMGDKPSRLLAEINTARAKGVKTVIPPVVAKEPKPTNPFPTGENNLPKPTEIAGSSKGPPAPPMPTELPTPAAEAQARKDKAVALLAEANQFRAEGKLLDARKKAMEAQKLGATFGPAELSPDLVCQQLALDASRRVDALMAEAQLAAGPEAAEGILAIAREIAEGFGQDTKPIVEKLESVRGQHGSYVKGSPPGGTPAAPPEKSKGQELVEKARLELQRGETNTARHMAEQALEGNYGVQEEALAMLRSIDNEEFNQQRLQAVRTYDAAEAAYRRHDYRQASNLLAAMDVRLLDDARKSRLREISSTAEMQPGLAKATDRSDPKRILDKGVDETSSKIDGNVRLTGGKTTPEAGDGGVGRATVSDQVDEDLERTKEMRKIAADKLRQDGLEAQRLAAEKFRGGQYDEALNILQEYLNSVGEVSLDHRQAALLTRPVQSRLENYRLMKAQAELASNNKATLQSKNDAVKAELKAEELKHKNVERLMKEFHVLYKEGKYQEAESTAMRAQDLDPDNTGAQAAVMLVKTQIRKKESEQLHSNKEKMGYEALNEAEGFGDAADALHNGGITVNADKLNRARKRQPLTPIEVPRRLNETERAIERKLSTPVNLNFYEAPLRRVLQDLSETNGINITTDEPALHEDGISLDFPISKKLEQISLRSALNIVLHDAHLTYVIRNEVLLITTPAHAADKQTQQVHHVADLVIPIYDPGDLNKAAGVAPTPTAPPTPGTSLPTPVTGLGSLSQGSPIGSSTGAATGSPFASTGSTNPAGAKVNPKTMEETLMKLITSTVAPKTWEDVGGSGHIEYYPLTMSLVINQTPDIQEQVSDLLAALRRLQDQEVAVEVRYITINESFFERIGVNFQVNLPSPTNTAKFQPGLLTNVFQQNPNFLNVFQPDRLITGITPAGTLSPTLNVPISNQSFLQTVPRYGGYSAGGLTMGLAFLSDIQVFLFLEAAQGDQRTNIMQAPKLTMFNGQTATIQIGDNQSFVTGVQVQQVGGGQFVFSPQTAQNGNNINLTIQPVISADRRFVRMSFATTLNALLPGPVQLFPVVVPIFTSFEGQSSGQPVVFTQFIQQPVISTVTVNTTVAVPDGGTVLMGGLKKLSESRSEYGPPILSKIPYWNRLFKNVGYGRDIDSLLIMVTPRIIIQEEEEERATGFRRDAAVDRP